MYLQKDLEGSCKKAEHVMDTLHCLSAKPCIALNFKRHSTH